MFMINAGPGRNWRDKASKIGKLRFLRYWVGIA